MIRFTKRASVPSLLWLTIGLILGCNGESSNPDVATESEVDSESETVAPQPQWSVEMVQDISAGVQTRLALGPTGELGLTYFANESYEDGICTEIEVNPPTRLRQTFYFASKASTASPWTVEEVSSPVVIFAPTGLSLAYTPSGEPSIAFTGGEPEGQYCGANDAVLATRVGGVWQFETASALSGDSQSGLVGSDEGMVVGLWPALRYSASGDPAIVHKDVHFGALQSIDKKKTDAEFAWRLGSGWIHEAIDANEGAGEYNELIFDGDTPIAFYGIPVEAQQDSRRGVWAARRSATGSWEERVQLHVGAIYQEISAAINPVTKELVVAFYSATDKAVRIRRLADLTRFAEASAWESDIVGSAIYDEGRYVSLAFTPAGTEVLAYHRCKKNSSTSDSCDQNDQGAILATRGAGGKWAYQLIEAANLGSCGEYTSLVIDAAGVAHVVYRCTETDGDQFRFRLFVASKEIESSSKESDTQ